MYVGVLSRGRKSKRARDAVVREFGRSEDCKRKPIRSLVLTGSTRDEQNYRREFSGSGSRIQHKLSEA